MCTVMNNSINNDSKPIELGVKIVANKSANARIYVTIDKMNNRDSKVISRTVVEVTRLFKAIKIGYTDLTPVASGCAQRIIA